MFESSWTKGGPDTDNDDEQQVSSSRHMIDIPSLIGGQSRFVPFGRLPLPLSPGSMSKDAGNTQLAEFW